MCTEIVYVYKNYYMVGFYWGVLLILVWSPKVKSTFITLIIFVLHNSELPRQNCAVQRLANCHIDSFFFDKVKPLLNA